MSGVCGVLIVLSVCVCAVSLDCVHMCTQCLGQGLSLIFGVDCTFVSGIYLSGA